MMRWYSITTQTKEAVRNIVKDLRKQHLLVREVDDKTYACIGNAHQSWLVKVVTDFGGQVRVLEEAPKGQRIPAKEEYILPCGEKVYDPVMVGQHIRWCNKCKEIEQGKRKAKGEIIIPGEKAVVTAKLEPGQSFNLDGVIASLEITRDQFWQELEQLDKVLENLKGYRDAKTRLDEFSKEAGLRLNAARQLLKEGKV